MSSFAENVLMQITSFKCSALVTFHVIFMRSGTKNKNEWSALTLQVSPASVPILCFVILELSERF